jgi:glycosyltransferase involved in cell wall biosynthesis
LARTRPDAVITASVFDADVLDAVRAAPARWLARVHDHRVFCPTGDRVFPQFSGICTAPMGDACRRNTLVHGCVHGPRPASFRAISAREHMRDRLAGADRVLVSSDHMRQTCMTNGIADGRIAITPPPLADDAFADAPLARPPHASLLFAGRLTERKGLRSLIAALGRIDAGARPSLVVAGTGADEQRIATELARSANVTVSWLGQLSPAELRDAIDAATAVAMPSMWPEPFGLVGIEAQARGRPAVAYRVGGIAEWIGDAGIAVPRGDEAALAAAIQKVFDQRHWPAFSAAAWQRAQAYRLAAHVDRFLELCDAA